MEYDMSGHAARRAAERRIALTWIEAALAAPDRVEPDALDPTARHAIKRIDAAGTPGVPGGRVLRVIYNPSVSPPRVISVYFDRRLKGSA